MKLNSRPSLRKLSSSFASQTPTGAAAAASSHGGSSSADNSNNNNSRRLSVGSVAGAGGSNGGSGGGNFGDSNYDAVISANLQVLAQILDQVRKRLFLNTHQRWKLNLWHRFLTSIRVLTRYKKSQMKTEHPLPCNSILSRIFNLFLSTFV